MAEDENLEQKQKARMLEQMQSSWDEIDTEKSLGFDDFSLETFRQELLEELRRTNSFINHFQTEFTQVLKPIRKFAHKKE
jgi:hypothetical protein